MVLLISVVDLVFGGLSMANEEFFRSGSMTTGSHFVLEMTTRWHDHPVYIFLIFFKVTVNFCTVIDMVRKM